jgi:hypothetical protein
VVLIDVIFTEHAKQRMIQREISEEEAIETLKNPDSTKQGKPEKQIAIKTFSSKTVRVVYVIENENKVIITVTLG